MTTTTTTSSIDTDFASELQRARQRTLRIVDWCDDAELERQHSPLMSPLVWDLAHIAYFEELWLRRRLGKAASTDPRFDDLYDAFSHDRATRAELPLLRPTQARAFADAVREHTLELIDANDWDRDDPLTRDGYVVGLVVQHELQHQETMLQTLQIAGIATDIERPTAPPPRAACSADEEVILPDGEVLIGAANEPWAYDNELPVHRVEVPAFAIGRYPVTNDQWLQFIEDGGYLDAACWSEQGLAWRSAEHAFAPLYWTQTADGWQRARFGQLEPVAPDEPVQHISWYEAEAFAAWAGKRLPTEVEWERAAHAARKGNLGMTTAGPLPIADRSGSHAGCMCMLGDVWEWTASHFAPYPGFRAYPYREYSEVFFGEDHRVLRGGSWATDPIVARTSFRNWDLPQRRQIFSGVRLAATL